jgi:hypothetical protein
MCLISSQSCGALTAEWSCISAYGGLTTSCRRLGLRLGVLGGFCFDVDSRRVNPVLRDRLSARAAVRWAAWEGTGMAKPAHFELLKDAKAQIGACGIWY